MLLKAVQLSEDGNEQRACEGFDELPYTSTMPLWIFDELERNENKAVPPTKRKAMSSTKNSDLHPLQRKTALMITPPSNIKMISSD
jgi:hypothetical protein